MFSNVLSASICGVECQGIQVEADVSDGLPMFVMVGYLTAQVKEAQERVKTAIRNSGIHLQPKKVTINLSPADLRKDGTAFDLPIALAVLTAYGYLKSEELSGKLVIGELGLDGKVKGIKGVLPIVRYAAENGYDCCIVPSENAREGGMIQGITVIGVDSIGEVLEFLRGNIELKETTVNIEEIQKELLSAVQDDFQDISGQAVVKRAAEVAAAGMHNLLLIGAPGAAKTMIAKCIPGILPELTLDEMLEVSEIYSIAGLLNERQPLIPSRPFRTPHHTITAPALVGGGQIPKPGEISLAHRGVLFLDELPEFKKTVLEMLRQPMEEKSVWVNRRSRNYEFPAGCVVIAAMNPCKCGYYPDAKRCTCTDAEIHQYVHKVSGPLLDRIDISVEAARVEYQQLAADQKAESSASIRKRVRNAQKMQRQRYMGTSFQFNSDLNPDGIKKYCKLGKAENELMAAAYERLGLSARGYHRILKVARTIADLDGKEKILSGHIAEAICYRSVEQKYWR